jgi:transposase
VTRDLADGLPKDLTEPFPVAGDPQVKVNTATDPAPEASSAWPHRSDRDVLEGIAFVPSTGIGWTKLPAELGYGSGWTCWRRLHEWAATGVFNRVHRAVLDRLGQRGELDWSRASLNSVSVRAKSGVH